MTATREEWIQLGVKYCEHVDKQVELIEKRVYPIGFMNHNGEQYRVLSRRCSAGFECTHMDAPCAWVEKEADGRQYNR